MDSQTLPPSLDCAPELCFCGRKTVESHEFWFCSIECARLDSLRSLGDANCHYRNVVRDAYFQAGPAELQPRRVASAVHIRPGPSAQRVFANVHLPIVPQPQQADIVFPNETTRDRNMPGFPTLSQLTGKVISKKAAAGEPLVAGNHNRPRWEGLPSRSPHAPSPQQPSGAFQQISLDAIPMSEHVSARTLRHVPSSMDRPRRDNPGKSTVGALLNYSRSRKNKDPETVFGHIVNPIIPPARKESLSSYRQMSPAPPVSAQAPKALRRSVSFSGGNATAHGGRYFFNERDPLMHIIEELREELSESFDPRSVFDREDD